MKNLMLSLLIFCIPHPLLSEVADEATAKVEGGIIESSATIHTGADEYRKNKDYVRAIEEYHKLLAQKNYDPVTHRKIASCYMRVGLYRKAIEHGEIYLKTNPKSKNMLWLLAHLNNRVSDYERTMYYLKRLREQYKTLNARYYLELGRCYLSRGKLDEAIKAFESALQAPSRSEDGHELWVFARTRLGYIYTIYGNYVQAKDEIRQALRISEEIGSPYREMAFVNYCEGNLEEAILWVEDAIGRKYDTPWTKLLAYEIYKEMNNNSKSVSMLAEAKSEIKNAIEKNKREDGTYFGGLANIFIEENDFENTRHYAQKALEFKPNYANNLIMGLYYFKTGDNKRALRYFEKSKKLNPVCPNTSLYLIKTYRRLNRFIDAQKEINAALKINPYNRFVRAEAEKVKSRMSSD